MLGRVMVILKHIPLIAVHILVYAGVWSLLYPTLHITAPVLAVLLIWISCRDVVVTEIPDVAAVVLIISGVLFAPELLWSVGAALLWAAIYLGVAQGVKWWMGRAALGLGDVKLIAGLAAWVGPVAPVYVTLFASLAAIGALGVITAVRREKLSELTGTGIAFGPFLCLSAWAIWLTGTAP